MQALHFSYTIAWIKISFLYAQEVVTEYYTAFLCLVLQDEYAICFFKELVLRLDRYQLYSNEFQNIHTLSGKLTAIKLNFVLIMMHISILVGKLEYNMLYH